MDLQKEQNQFVTGCTERVCGGLVNYEGSEDAGPDDVNAYGEPLERI